jgi:murein DD-endopeptidase MepM/ murein hydrolase activator NlpD
VPTKVLIQSHLQIAFAVFLAATLPASLARALPDEAANPSPITVTTATPKQGQTFEVTVNAAGLSSPPEVEFNHKAYKTFPAEEAGQSKYQVLLSVPADLSPGKYVLSSNQIQKTIEVTSGKFIMQHLALAKKTAELKPSPGEEEAVDQAKQTLSDQRLWSGRFQIPCNARVSTTFGAGRIVNGKPLTDYFHSGIDYAGAMGAPVKACAAGKVIMARTGFALHGNVVAIDHGHGVVSFYLHLSKIMVKPGQLVKAGTQIGKVGESGRANGPHLHFSLYVNQVATNPNDWYKQSF